MNMKKTIAAIAAGAVAVSAMATTVSALESGTLNYNLVNTLEDQSNGKLTLKATFPNVKLVNGQDTVIGVKNMAWTDKVVVSGQYIDTNKAINPITYTRDIWSEGYSAATEAKMDTNWTTNVTSITIPVKAVNDGTPALIGGPATATPGTDKIPGTPEVATAVSSTGAILNVNTAILKANKLGSGKLTYKAAVTAVTGGWDDGAGNAPTGTTKTMLDAIAAPADGATQVIDGTTWTYTKPVTGVTAGFYDANGKSAADYGVDVTTLLAGAGAGDTITVTYTAAGEDTPAVPGVDIVTANITVTVTMKAITDKDWENLNKRIKHPEHAEGLGISLNGVYGDATGSGFTAPTKRRAPLMTYYTDNLNILEYLEKAHVNGTDKGYANVTAVINDAIENYETVTFTFNTATANVAWGIASIGTDGVNKYNPTMVVTKNDGKQKSRTDMAALYGEMVKKTDKWGEQYDDWKYDRDDYIIMGYYPDNDWEGVDTYKAFGDHAYDWYYSPEGTGMLGMDWAGQDLFAGALVVNEKQTMSLGNTEYFDWTKTAISFDWDAIMDGAATTNSYATYVHSLKLATSAYWFWDSMDLVLTAGDADDVSADAGVEADDETLDDDADDDIVADDEDDEPVVDDEDEEPAAPVVDEEPATVVTNPPTGNASVALAVIPVALAAAAIVAKKRG